MNISSKRANYVPRTEFAAALAEVANGRGIDPQIVIESIKSAIVAAFRKDGALTGEYKEDWMYEVELDSSSGEAKVFGFPKPIVAEGEEVSEEQVEVARKGRVEVTPPGFGRIAAQTAKQVILQKIREAEKDAVILEYEKKIGTLINALILRFVGHDIVVDLGKGEAVMPNYEQVPSENYKIGQRMVFYVEGIRDGIRGKEVVLSRAHKGLVEGLFKREVPEVANGAVEIKAIARESGVRTKIAVYSSQSGVDPVGSCVGQKGVRVQAVIEELNNEKVDIIQYSEDADKFIVAALAPAANMKVVIDAVRKSAIVTVAEDQLSLAIGKEGQNVRLASKLTDYKIDIVSEKGTSEAVAEDAAGAGTPTTTTQTDDSLVAATEDTKDEEKSGVEEKVEEV